MAVVNVKVTHKKYYGGVSALIQRVKQMREAIYIGIPATESSRDDEVNNATLGYIHEFGKGVPARPWLRPSIRGYRIQAVSRLHKDLPEVLLGGLSFDQCLNRIGIEGASAVRSYILNSGNFTPNSPYTIAQKGSSKPLIDTGQMMRSVSHVVMQDRGNDRYL